MLINDNFAYHQFLFFSGMIFFAAQNYFVAP